MEQFIATGLFAFTTAVIFGFEYMQVGARPYQQIFAGCTILLMVVCIWSSRLYKKGLSPKRLEWPFLFIGNILIQIIITISGGIASPFFILYHFATLGISFMINFSTAVQFLLFSSINISIITYLNPSLHAFFFDNLPLMILYFVSFLTIVPLSYILANRYHLKDTLFAYLANRVKVEESIIADLKELIFVTDESTNILSINDSVERLFLRSRSELYHTQLFDILYIKDTAGTLLTTKTLLLDEISKADHAKQFDDLLLIPPGKPRRKITMTIKPISDLFDKNVHFCFIITEKDASPKVSQAYKSLAEVRTQHEAMIDELKKTLHDQGLAELEKQLLIIAKTEQDIMLTQIVDSEGISEQKMRIDIATLCSETVQYTQSFAKIFNVHLAFELKNFTHENIAPLVTNIFNIKPEQLTGPFFTAACDIHYLRLLIQKLLEMSVLLASKQENPSVNVHIEQKGKEEILIHIITATPHLSETEHDDMFTKLYGLLRMKSNLQLSSGLEGYLAKQIATEMNIPIAVSFDTPTRCTITLCIKKN